MSEENTQNFNNRFVEEIIKLCKQSKGNAATLRKADIPTQNSCCWGIFVKLNIDIENKYKSLPYYIVAAAIARTDEYSSGILPFGKALKLAESNSRNDESGDLNDLRLRRILSCNDIIELSSVIRPILKFIESKVSDTLDFCKFLEDLKIFNKSDYGMEIVKTKWVKQFYSNVTYL